MNLCFSIRQKFKSGNAPVPGGGQVARTLDASGEGVVGRSGAGWLPRWLTADHPLPWLLPMTAMLLAFGVYPLLYSLWLSFQERNRLTRQYEFAGLKQWAAAFADERMWHALTVTLTYTVAALVVQLVLGMLIALLLDTDRRGYGFLRALMTLPLVVPPAVTGMMFLLMQDGQFGVLNHYFVQLGLIDRSSPMLGTPSTALIGLMLADVWQWTPFMVLIFLAGLRALPKEPYEAAAIDGASAVQQFWHLTLPMLGRVIGIAVLIRGIDLFRIYDYVYVMTGGGPGTTTETMSFYAGRVFGVANFPYAATLSLITLIALNLLAALTVKIGRVRF
jgi:multiple sugar transport system permease protein